jgi:hypothetical protein
MAGLLRKAASGYADCLSKTVHNCTGLQRTNQVVSVHGHTRREAQFNRCLNTGRPDNRPAWTFST